MRRRTRLLLAAGAVALASAAGVACDGGGPSPATLSTCNTFGWGSRECALAHAADAAAANQWPGWG